MMRSRRGGVFLGVTLAALGGHNALEILGHISNQVNGGLNRAVEILARIALVQPRKIIEIFSYALLVTSVFSWPLPNK